MQRSAIRDPCIIAIVKVKDYIRTNMSKSGEHSKLIADAAKAALSPIGCTRVGRSRTWISDQGFWLVVIEFQPSSWSKGSYLNVGAMWLWKLRKGLGFHHGYRVGDFVPFMDETQFRPLIEILAAQAAARTMELRDQFSSIEAVSHYLTTATTNLTPWSPYHAALAAGLAGDYTTAHRHFEQFALSDWQDSPWLEAKARAEQLDGLLATPSAFRTALIAQIVECRTINNLQPASGTLEALLARDVT